MTIEGRDRADVVSAIERAGVVAVIRLKDPTVLAGVVDALVAGGVHVLEITMTVPGAVELIRGLGRRLPSGFLLGAGTVTDVATANDVIDAGAAFVVSPVLRLEVIAACHRRSVPALPGCFSPTEILTAWEAGADIAVFPATALGPGYFKDVRVRRRTSSLPTGGVSIENRRLDSPARSRWASAALLDAAIAAGNFPSSPPTPRASSPTQAVGEGSLMPRVVTFGEIMMRLPARIRAVLAPPVPRRRSAAASQRAVSLAHSAARAGS
jgi:2-dehydro-3-deoxyphosphogluconate aldolase/(4S)-4-hydroxy-2-oxoglutarate aldolase